MPSSVDRKRLEVPTYLYDRLVDLSIQEARTVASITQEVIATGLQYREAAINPDRDFLRFSPRARKSVEIAREETAQFSHAYIGTEHLLLGLLKVTDGIAARALAELGVDYEKVRDWMLTATPRGKGTVPPLAELSYLPRCRKALRFAIEEADRYGNQFVGTEHLLLGLLRVTDGYAAHTLAYFGVLPDVQGAVLRIMWKPRDEKKPVAVVEHTETR